jgi:hypothetical protein
MPRTYEPVVKTPRLEGNVMTGWTLMVKLKGGGLLMPLARSLLFDAPKLWIGARTGRPNDNMKDNCEFVHYDAIESLAIREPRDKYNRTTKIHAAGCPRMAEYLLSRYSVLEPQTYNIYDEFVSALDGIEAEPNNLVEQYLNMDAIVQGVTKP